MTENLKLYEKDFHYECKKIEFFCSIINEITFQLEFFVKLAGKDLEISSKTLNPTLKLINNYRQTVLIYKNEPSNLYIIIDKFLSFVELVVALFCNDLKDCYEILHENIPKISNKLKNIKEEILQKSLNIMKKEKNKNNDKIEINKFISDSFESVFTGVFKGLIYLHQFFFLFFKAKNDSVTKIKEKGEDNINNKIINIVISDFTERKYSQSLGNNYEVIHFEKNEFDNLLKNDSENAITLCDSYLSYTNIFLKCINIRKILISEFKKIIGGFIKFRPNNISEKILKIHDKIISTCKSFKIAGYSTIKVWNSFSDDWNNLYIFIGKLYQFIECVYSNELNENPDEKTEYLQNFEIEWKKYSKIILDYKNKYGKYNNEEYRKKIKNNQNEWNNLRNKEREIKTFLDKSCSEFLLSNIPTIRGNEKKKAIEIQNLCYRYEKMYKKHIEECIENTKLELLTTTSVDIFSEVKEIFTKNSNIFQIKDFDNYLDDLRDKVISKIDFEEDELSKIVKTKLIDYYQKEENKNNTQNSFVESSPRSNNLTNLKEQSVILNRQNTDSQLNDLESKEIYIPNIPVNKSQNDYVNKQAKLKILNFERTKSIGKFIRNSLLSPFSNIIRNKSISDQNGNNEKNIDNDNVINNNEKNINNENVINNNEKNINNENVINNNEKNINNNINNDNVNDNINNNGNINDNININITSNNNNTNNNDNKTEEIMNSEKQEKEILLESTKIKQKNINKNSQFTFGNNLSGSNNNLNENKSINSFIQINNTINIKEDDSSANIFYYNIPSMKNKLLNRSKKIYDDLKEINFFERLDKISKERMLKFEKEFKKDNLYFLSIEEFDNIFINQKDIRSKSPLTLIFHYIFNPNTTINEYPHGKSFFESIFLARGDYNLDTIFDKRELEKVPKYFNDFDYVNNLFIKCNKNELDNFLNKIDNWKSTFSFQLNFVHPIKKLMIGPDKITIRDVAKVYFISPNDLIVDYHTYGSDFPFADTFVSISQYRFHCNIKFNKAKGRFVFKTSAIVYNKVALLSKSYLESVLKNEADKNNKIEIQNHTWEPFRIVVETESLNNEKKTEKIFMRHLKNTISNYSDEIPENYDVNFDSDSSNNASNDSDIYDSSIIKNNKKKTENKNEKQKDKNKNEIVNDESVYYGILCLLALFSAKTIFSLIKGELSLDIIINILIIVLICFVITKLNKKEDQD